MITFVCLCNLAIALINLFVAWRVWKLRGLFVDMAKTLTEVEATVCLVLAPAPNLIGKGKTGTRLLSDRYQKLERLLQQTQSAIAFFSLVYGTWRGQSRLGRSSRPRRQKRGLL